MVSNYLRIAIRNLLKNKGYSFINLFGLTLGIASSLLILLFVFYELSYENYQEYKDRVYRLAIKAQIGDTKINQTFSSARNLWELRERCPEIEDAVKFFQLENVSVKVGDTRFAESRFLGADSSLFEVFSHTFLHGSKESALNQPNTIVLSEQAADRYFGRTDVMGEQLLFELPWNFGTMPFTVSAVIENIPQNTHLRFDFVVSLISFPSLINNTGWSSNNFQTYLKLYPGSDPESLEAKFDEYVKEYMGERYDSFIEGGGSWDFFLQALPSIHLHSDLNGEFEQNGNKKYVYFFSIIALFVLAIASINFMNLSTAKSALRAREVGIRKLSGSTRGMLIRQFLTESVVLSFVSLFLAVILAEICLPAFRNLVGKPLYLPLWNSFTGWPLLLVAALLLGFLSGLYPAFFLSRFKPIQVLKGRIDSGNRGMRFRNTLVVIQFAASIFLIAGTLVVQRQIRFLQDSDIGFDKSNVAVVHLPPGFEKYMKVFSDQVLSVPEILEVSGCSGLPGTGFANIGFNSPSVENSFALNIYTCDENYLDVLGMHMQEGRFFSEDYSTDSTALVLNETAVKALNLEAPIGTLLRTNGEGSKTFTLIGVVKDYHYESMHATVRPLGLFLQGGAMTRPLNNLAVKIVPGSEKKVVEKLEKAWKDMVPELVFNYSYLENNYNNLYNNEALTRKVFSLLSLLALIVASLGLFGLASFLTENRRKEVGIRKVMGASVERIILLLTSKFSIWIGVSFLVAAPTAWFAMKNWLQGFEYRQDLSGWIFAFAGGIALVIALLSISTITWRAASRNPIESLRYE